MKRNTAPPTAGFQDTVQHIELARISQQVAALRDFDSA
jgi:hypothetical protein